MSLKGPQASMDELPSSTAMALLRSSDGVEFDLTKMIGGDEDFQGLPNRTDVYPLIDPSPIHSAKAFKDKVVLLTGASRGIGAEIARQYARAGATLALVARNQGRLDALKESLEKDTPGIQVSTFALSVTDTAAAEQAVKQTVERFGRLDVVVASAGITRVAGERIGTVDAATWWKTIEVNLRGVFNFVHFSLPHLEKTKGTVVAVTSAASHYRVPTLSDYSISKFALERFIEFIPIEYSGVRSFALNPGTVDTDLSRDSEFPVDPKDICTPALAATTILHLSAGKFDWLSGRYVSAQWDLGTVERDYKAKILEKNGLVSKLSIP